jgi:hypothetical protein
MRRAALTCVVVLTACGGGHGRKPVADKPSRCSFPRVWYPAALPGYELRHVSRRQRVSLLKSARIPEEGADVVAETKRGLIIAAFIRVRHEPDAVKRRYDGLKLPREAVVTEPLAHVRRIDGPKGTIEYGRKGCALLFGLGDAEVVDAGFVVMYSND